jgi:hypothetical protein
LVFRRHPLPDAASAQACCHGHSLRLHDAYHSLGVFALLQPVAAYFAIDPLPQLAKHTFGFGISEVRHPSGQVAPQFLDHLSELYATIAGRYRSMRVFALSRALELIVSRSSPAAGDLGAFALR